MIRRLLCTLGLVQPPDALPLVARSPEWPRVRKAHLRAHPRCEACGGLEGVEVHHLYPVGWPNGKASELVADNLLTLCEKNGCHLRIGHLGDYRSRNPQAALDAAFWRRKILSRPYPPEAKA